MKHFSEKNNTLTSKFEFKNFSEAIKFVNLVGNIAEISDHHPDILLHNYKYVTITTTTHDLGNTLTEKDYAIAERIEASYRG
ncbi:4a-hydroxytetrahydrobiopterin dehydratase [Candidatus Gracilibacteria bacterium]|nr:4a-hydroxytetrahydrobiopterin dehydratase [Candidatus Gracilibacteria bacterium]